MTIFASADDIRALFSQKMSAMYRAEVPAYGTLIDIVAETNQAVLHQETAQKAEDVSRLSEERHGAIRLGTADELAMMARIFAIMGMYPVSYYDLGSAGIPVHSTAFRPIDRQALAHNPFRIFTSLLRLELIEDEALRHKAQTILSQRQIFTEQAIALTAKAEAQGGLSDSEAEAFVAEVLETFRWTGRALVDEATYETLHQAHRLVADVVAFPGPHINHLTPRTLDIEGAQQAMIDAQLPAKAVIEGPPPRECPLLLRQTSFKALHEDVRFLANGDDTNKGHIKGHTARFGEIEQRGVALTPKGRALYDALLANVRANITPAPDGHNAKAYRRALCEGFAAFPDDWQTLYDKGLAYFRADGLQTAPTKAAIAHQAGQSLCLSPIIYEDFLPVSAAGIFQSNLGDEARHNLHQTASQSAFEAALGRAVLDEFALYQAIQDESFANILG